MLAARSYKFDAGERPDIIDQLLTDLGDGNLIGPVLREAIAQSDWDAVLAWTDKVQGSDKDSGYHMYWRGRALEALGQSEAAHHEAMFQSVLGIKGLNVKSLNQTL